MRSIHWVMVLAGCVAIGFWIGRGLHSDAPPAVEPAMADEAVLSARDDLSAAERRTIELFSKSRGAIVNIATTGRELNVFTRQVREVQRGVGSGFVWDDKGHIVTNFHVVAGASSAYVTFEDQSQYGARLVGVSPDHDLAVLRIEAHSRDIEALPIGRSANLLVGQHVYAIGNPYGLDHTLTRGLISALDRQITSVSGRPIEGAIQTDAAINPGNSGGPLLDSAGRVIGVNTVIYSPSGASAGIGFAVPIDTVSRVVPQLIAKGKYQPPVIGIETHDRISASLLRNQRVKGVLVLHVRPGSAAQRAGLVATRRDDRGRIVLGDVITAIEGKPIANSNDLFLALEQHEPGDTVEVNLYLRGEQRTVELTLE